MSLYGCKSPQSLEIAVPPCPPPHSINIISGCKRSERGGLQDGVRVGIRGGVFGCVTSGVKCSVRGSVRGGVRMVYEVV